MAVSKSHTAVGVSASLTLPRAGTTVDFALSGTYAQTIQFERALTPDESAWEVVSGPYSTANATVAAAYITRSPGERLRSRAIAFTSGTAVTSLTERGVTDRRVVDALGEAVGLVRDSGEAIIKSQPYAIGSTKTVTVEEHAGRIGLLDTASGSVVTLPAATGSGAEFDFVISVVATTNSHIIKVANTVDSMQGILVGVGAAATDLVGYSAVAGTDDTVTLNRTTTGSTVKGERIKVKDIAAGIWQVDGVFKSSGTQATPFSATV